MNKKIIQAVVLGFFSSSVAFAADPVVTVDQPAQKLPAGAVAKTLNDQEDVRSVLASTVNAALSKGDFKDVIDNLTSADEKRIEDFVKSQDLADLDARVEAIRRNWEQKYGTAFKLDAGKALNGFVIITEGEISDPATLRTHWPVMTGERKTADQRPMRDPASPAAAPAAPNTEDSTEYYKAGRNVAVVSIPSSHGHPAVTVSMLHELVDDWRIDVPDNITGGQIFTNLKDGLAKVSDNVGAWPNDQTEAYRYVAHTVLSSLYNVPNQMTTTPKD